MPVSFTIIPQHRLVVLCPTGVVTVNCMFRYFEALWAHPDWRPGLNRLADTRRMVDMNVTYDEMRNIRANEAPMPDPNAILPDTVLMCTTDISYGMARMFQSIERTPPRDRVHIVETFEKAFAILLIPAENWRDIIADPPV